MSKHVSISPAEAADRLAIREKHEVLEGDPIEGIVIAKFPNVKAAKDWYYSEAYQRVAKHRKDGAIYHGLIVEGVS